PAAERGSDGDGHEEEACVRDARVREHPLDVGLDERAEVPTGERDADDDRERDRPEVLLVREGGHEQPHRQDERRDLRRRGHERGHRRRRALVDVWRPHVERRRRGLESEPDDDHREARDEEELVRVSRSGGDVLEADDACGAVDERTPEEKDRRAEAPDDQVLEAGLERCDLLDRDRTEDVERDREPLEPEEHRHQVVGGDEEAHACRGGEQEGVVLAHPLPEDIGVRDSHCEEPGAGDQDLGELGEAVAADGVRHDGGAGLVHLEERDRSGARAEEGQDRDEGAEVPAPPVRQEQRDEQADRCSAEEDQLGRERGPVERGRGELRQGAASNKELTVPAGLPPKEWSVIAAGQKESASRRTTSGTMTPISAGRRSSAASVTAEPGFLCRTAEIRRSMYIAASTMATAPATAQPQPRVKIPFRIKNSPANALDPGTARAITPVVISIVATTGRPRAIPPRRARFPVAARLSTAPARRKSAAETSPCVTICRSAPEMPESLTAKRPMTMRFICARLEYAITPRTSGARNASSEP